MANGWSLLIGLVFIAVFCVVAWFASPKGENQTYVGLTGFHLPPSPALLLGLCGIRWQEEKNGYNSLAHQPARGQAITFLAQWHPLITPKRGDLRPELINHEGPSGMF
ncbi:hypothetical protein B0A49_08587 [Cryomyces minteri]|uniref:Uncharacterized protein n=1 Tax=Cryomyces minteri TaxID=331657 RepID=A0A4U0WXU7_9PEZI|nr:hypothetical protein B0A49_08587 [Cryomyces minteri]